MLSLTLASSLSTSVSLKSPRLPTFRPIETRCNQHKNLKQRRLRLGKCRAEWSADGPVTVAIGACILSSLILPANPLPQDTEDESLIDSGDTRFAVMGIISFIPYFNWMSWVFAWMDTGKRRYAVYALVYLAPYLRPNLSISPEDSWLPTASILLCIAHVQLEASIKNGDVHGFQIFSNAISRLSWKKKSNTLSEEEEEDDIPNLPSEKGHYRNEMRDWAARKKLQQEDEILNEDHEDNGNAKS